MNIGVVGAGMMGLVVAERLSRAGHRTVLFDRVEQLGGLCTWHDYGDFVWDRFYHVILPSDRLLIDLIRDLGLGSKLRWQASRTGFFQNNVHYSVSTNLEFLKFPLLSPVQKARMAWTFLYGSRLKNWRSLENVSAEDWLIRHSGRQTYETFWRPMLMAKLGEHHRSVSAVFIWSYIKRLFTAHDPTVGKEQLGHVEGGYRTVIEELAKRVRKRGEIKLRHTVTRVSAGEGSRLVATANDREVPFDRIVYTGPAHLAKKILGDELVDVTSPRGEIRYLGVICMVLITHKPVTPYYVLNIADESMPFTGVIGMSSVVDPAETGDLCLTYFPRYLDFADPMFERDDEDIRKEFLTAATRLFPDLRREDIVGSHIHRARVVQPLQVLNYSAHAPRVTTRHPGLFVLNTGQISNNTVHNNQVVRMVRSFLEDNRGAFPDDDRGVETA